MNSGKGEWGEGEGIAENAEMTCVRGRDFSEKQLASVFFLRLLKIRYRKSVIFCYCRVVHELQS